MRDEGYADRLPVDIRGKIFTEDTGMLSSSDTSPRGCKEIADLKLRSFAGGTGSTAIPREAEAVVLFRVSEKEVLLGKIEEIGAEMTVEYQGVAPDFSLVAEEVEVTDGCCYDEESFEKFLAVMELFPRGIMEMSGVFPGVGSSINVGIVKTQGDKCTFYAELRGSLVPPYSR